MQQLGNHTNAQLEENMLRHMILNSLRYYKTKFGKTHGEMVIATDSPNQWRKQYFPFYKANRKKNIENSELDWKSVFESLHRIKSELKEFSPYRVIDVPTSEADDIIATLAMHKKQDGQKTLIMSADKDFIQLHVYPWVVQYDPIRKKWIEHDDPDLYRRQHIIKGDTGDGIPNVLSGDDCLVTGERQKSLTQKRMEYLLSTDPDAYDENTKRNWYRNFQIIDLHNVPTELETEILRQYDDQATKDQSKMLDYLLKFKMTRLVESLSDFYIAQ